MMPRTTQVLWCLNIREWWWKVESVMHCFLLLNLSIIDCHCNFLCHVEGQMYLLFGKYRILHYQYPLKLWSLLYALSRWRNYLLQDINDIKSSQNMNIFVRNIHLNTKTIYMINILYILRYIFVYCGSGYFIVY